jgi:hypothetical protein
MLDEGRRERPFGAMEQNSHDDNEEIRREGATLTDARSLLVCGRSKSIDFDVE